MFLVTNDLSAADLVLADFARPKKMHEDGAYTTFKKRSVLKQHSVCKGHHVNEYHFEHVRKNHIL